MGDDVVVDVELNVIVVDAEDGEVALVVEMLVGVGVEGTNTRYAVTPAMTRITITTETTTAGQISLRWSRFIPRDLVPIFHVGQ
jgi:hypothetical protein